MIILKLSNKCLKLTAYNYLTFLLFSTSILAQNNIWHQLNSPIGGSITALALDSTGVVYAGTKKGIYYSSDGGDTWDKFSHTAIANRNILSIAVDSNNYLYAVTPLLVFKSADRGSTWVEVHRCSSLNTCITITFNSQIGLLIGKNREVRKSVDGGNSWGKIGDNMYDRVKALLVDESGTIFAGTGEKGMFRSVYPGTTWVEINNGINDAQGIYCKDMLSLTINSEGYIYAGTDGCGIFVTIDGGDSWVHTGKTNTFHPSLLVTSNNTILAGNYGGGISRSIDDGVSWVDKNTGASGNSRTVALLSNSDGNIVAGNDYAGILRSNDDGISWERGKFPGLTISSIAFNSLGYLFIATPTDGIYRSENSGESWIKINSGISNLYVTSLTVANDDEVFAVTGGGIYRTTNNGDNWSFINFDRPSPSGVHVAVNDSGHIFIGTGKGSILKSENNGATWSEKFLTQSWDTGISHVLINENGHIFAASLGEGVFRSIDNGRSWEKNKTAGLSMNRVHVLSVNKKGYLFAATSGAIWRSVDNGDNWRNLRWFFYNFSAFAFDDSDYVYAGISQDSRAFGVYKSEDDGITWAKADYGLRYKDVFSLAVSSDNQIYAGTNSGVYYSSNPIMINIGHNDRLIASDYFLSNNYPNPFNPTTTIGYTLQSSGEVTLIIYNLLGEEVTRLVDQHQPAGEYQAQWNASNFASGIYFYRLQAGDFVQTRKMVLLK